MNESLLNAMTACDAATPQEKHQAIDAAIINLQSVNSHLEDLLHRISGSAAPKESEAGMINDRASLVEILSSASARINDQVNIAHNLISEIESKLF